MKRAQSQPISTPKSAAREAEEPAAGVLWRLTRFAEGESARTVYSLPPNGRFEPLRKDVQAVLAALSTEASPLGAELGSSSAQSQPSADAGTHIPRSPDAPSLAGWALLTDDQRADIEAHIDGLTIADTKPYERPAHGWTCFHCGETFKTRGGGVLHFGQKVTGRPACDVVQPIIEAADAADAATWQVTTWAVPVADLRRFRDAHRAELSPDDGATTRHTLSEQAELSRLQHSLSLAVEALEFYASEPNWSYWQGVNNLRDHSPAVLDKGQIAREVHSKLTGGG